MKKMYRLVIAATFAFTGVAAQDYEHVKIASGLNEKVIAYGVQPASVTTTAAIDNDDHALMATTFQPVWGTPGPAYALPADGLIESAATSHLTFQLESYNVNTSFRMPAQNTPGILEFEDEIMASKLYLLATSAGGASTVTVTVHFSDNTSQAFEDVLVPDWYDSNDQPVAMQGIGRVKREGNLIENPENNPRLYQLLLVLTPENQLKMAESVEVVKTSAEDGVLNVFAVTAQLPADCDGVADLTSAAQPTSAVISWNPVGDEPSGGYDYYVSTSFEAPTDETEPTGNVPGNINAVPLNGLPFGVLHFVWVRSNCGGDGASGWQVTTFKTGELSVVYNDGDVATLYNETVTPESETTCAAEMSVTIPAGYKISNVFTMYSMTAAEGAFISQQRSLLACTTTDAAEGTLAAVATDTEGVQGYARNNIVIANGATGTVNFELRIWRTWGGTGCSTNYNKLDNKNWRLVITYEPIGCETPDEPEAEEQTHCQGSIIADLNAEGQAGAVLKWYADEEAGEPLAAETVLESGTYYVSQSIGTCESEREDVDVTVVTVAEPETDAEQAFCAGATVADLEATGATIIWYAEEEGGEPLAAATELENGSYFVKQIVGVCESKLAEVTVTINDIPDMPGGDATQDFADGDTIADLEVETFEGAVVDWYIIVMETEHVTVSTDTELSDGMTYYVTQTLGSCTSEPLAITVSEILGTGGFTLASLSVAPNPANDVLTVSANGTITGLKVFNLLGQQLMTAETNGETVQLNVSSLSEGTYLMHVQSENKTATVKFVKE